MKKLTVFLALVLGVALIAVPAYAEVQNVKVSGDIAIKGIYLSDLDFDTQGDNSDFAVTLTRLRIDADLTDNVAATIGLLNERDWDDETATDTQIDLDLAYISLKEMLYSPMSLTLGRQYLRYGNALIVGDPDTNAAAADSDLGFPILSLRKAFDAVKATMDYDPLMIDVIYAKIDETGTTASLTGGNAYADDTNLYGINLNYAFADYNAEGELYYFAKHNSDADGGVQTDETNVVGIRGSLEPVDALTLSGEYALQFGDYAGAANTTRDRDAWALDLNAKYALDMAYSPVIGIGYLFRSGEEPGDTGDRESWDPMYEDQTLVGIIADYQFAGENNGANSNIQAITAGLDLEPMADVTLEIDYAHLWLDEAYVTANNAAHSLTNAIYAVTTDDDLGDSLDITLTYDYTEDVELSLLGCLFFPGDTFNNSSGAGEYGKNDDTASAIAGSVKVSF